MNGNRIYVVTFSYLPCGKNVEVTSRRVYRNYGLASKQHNKMKEWSKKFRHTILELKTQTYEEV